MLSLASNSKRIIAGLLLGLFAFILAEKNIHRHEQAALFKVQQEHSSVQSTTACLICEFQLAANADLPILIADTPSTIALHDFNSEAPSFLFAVIPHYRF